MPLLPTMKLTRRLLLAGSCAALAISSAQAISIVALGADDILYRFDSATPGAVIPVATGFGGIVDIDFRGSNGLLYGIAGSGATFSIDPSNGTMVGLFSPNVSLGGSVTSFDFNPVADRMRVLVGGNTNFRIVPDGVAGMTAGTVVNGTAGDGSFAVPGGVSLLSFGYTNPTGGPSTTLYSIGSNNTLYIHSVGPEFNTVAAVGSGLGITLGAQVGFDIATDGLGYLSSGNNLYTVNLGTGAATLLGTAPVALRDIAVVPEPTVAALGALAGLGLLRRRR